MVSTRVLKRVAVAAMAVGLAWGAACEAKVEISFSAIPRKGSQNKDVMEMLVNRFNESQRDIHVRYVPASGDWSEKIMVQMVAGRAPDVVAAWDDILRRYIEGGMALDLSPYFLGRKLDDFNSNQLDVFRVNGKLFAMPFYMGISCLYYSTDAFRAAGVSEPGGDWNWADMVTAAQKMTLKDSNGKVSQYGYGLHNDWTRIYLWIYENGGKVIDAGKVLGTKCYLDSQEAIGAIKFQKDIMFRYRVSPPLGSPHDSFWQGKVATFQSGSWDLGGTMLYAKKGWDIALRPTGPKGIKASMFTTDGFIVTRNTKRKREAVKFLEFMTSPEAEEMMMTYADLQPARKSLSAKYSTETMPAKKGHNMKPFIAAMPYATQAPLFLKQKRVGEILTPALINMIYKENVDVESTLKKITAQINAVSSSK